MQGGGEMGAFMRSFDWSHSRLGPVSGWPQSLRTSVSTCLNSRFPILIWWGPDLVMLYNDAYRQIIGVKHPAALGNPGRECWHEIWHIVAPMLESVMERGEATWSADLLLLLERDGYPEECYFTFSYSPIRDESGGIGGVFTPVAETTERVINERRMATLRDLAARATTARDTQQACGAIAESLAGNPYGIPFASLYLFDETHTSATLCAAAGIQTGAGAAKPVIRVSELPKPLADAVITPALTYFQDLAGMLGPLPSGAWSIPARSGVILPILMPGQAAPIGFSIAGANPHKRLDPSYRTFFELVGQHISSAIAAAREYEQERQRAEALAEIDRAKTTFFSNVSHEFRTPLTLLLAPLEDALANRHGILPMGAAASLATSHRNALRLLKLVNTLLDFSRIEARRAQGSYQPVDLPALTADLASNFRSLCERAGLQFHVHCPPLASAKPAYVDPELWEKIVLNLLSNAFKFTLQGEIEVRLETDNDQAVLTVRDTGTGIPPDQLPHMFERFHRIERNRGRTQEGTGIGLALVRELARLHGGDVGVKSTLGGGSTFRVAIPLGSGHLDPSRVVVAHEVARNPVTSAAFVEEAMRWLPGEVSEDSELSSYSRTVYENRSEIGKEGKHARILWADDNADMRAYVSRLLRGSFELEIVADGKSALEAVRARKPDLVLADVMMPALDGFALLREIRSDPNLSEVPVILLSARAGEEARIEGLQAGADDYLTKPFSSRELLAVVRSNIKLSRLREQTAEAQTEADRTGGLLASIVESSDDAIVSKDLTGRITSWNRGAERLFGYTAQEAVGRSVTMLIPEDRQDEEPRILARLQRGERVDHFETIRRRKDGELLHVSLTISPVRGPAGRIVGASKIARDISDQKRNEASLRETQKLESLGLLAGGIAHDFNNLLTGVIGNASLLADELPAGTPQAEKINSLIQAAERMARLSSQMLAYSGRGHFVVESVDLSSQVTQIVGLIQASIPKNVELRLSLKDNLPLCEVDVSQLQQVIMNLVINAAESIGSDTGTVELSTGVEKVGNSQLRANMAQNAPPLGRYVVITVRDTGCGMDEGTRVKVFDPFFTTKFTGRGLGLSSVLGIVRGHKGLITVESRFQAGSTFRVFFPIVAARRPVESPPKSESPGGGTILVVDDEEIVRRLAKAALQRLGFTVLTAENGKEAVEVYAADPDRIDLVLLDMMMPVMSGEEAFRRLLDIRPNVTVLAMSGFQEREATERFGDRIAGFVQKPFTIDKLGAKVNAARRAASPESSTSEP
jgi:PAS domain S-box-containing protein